MRTTTALLLLTLAMGSVGAQAPTITSLLSKDVVGSPGKEVAMITVEYPPGGFDTVHRHNAQAFVYVLEGSVVMQVQGEAPITLRTGQTFSEEPADVHLVARNASSSVRARFLVFFVKDKGAPFLLPAK